MRNSRSGPINMSRKRAAHDQHPEYSCSTFYDWCYSYFAINYNRVESEPRGKKIHHKPRGEKIWFDESEHELSRITGCSNPRAVRQHRRVNSVTQLLEAVRWFASHRVHSPCSSAHRTRPLRSLPWISLHLVSIHALIILVYTATISMPCMLSIFEFVQNFAVFVN